jgi:hypothetical protein
VVPEAIELEESGRVAGLTEALAQGLKALAAQCSRSAGPIDVGDFVDAGEEANEMHKRTPRGASQEVISPPPNRDGVERNLD